MPLKQSLTRAVRFAVTSGAIVALAATAVHAQTNLLKNPGFEQKQELHPWMPANWDTLPNALPTVFFGRDTLGAHSGQYSVSIANTSTIVPLQYNWSQGVPVGPEVWNKDAVFTIWTKSNGVDGRAYVLLQAYRDTASKMAMKWGVDREDALRRLKINAMDDPLVDLGWKRIWFSDNTTDWVKREARVFIPPGVNMLFVRAGISGTGQVMFDDASLTIETAQPQPEVPLHTNLLADPSFEGDGNDWEFSVPPFEKARAAQDSTTAHSGRRSVRIEGTEGMVQAQAGACQVLCNHHLAGKRVRISAWVRTDGLKSIAQPKLYVHTLSGPFAYPAWQQFSADTPWTFTQFEQDLPPDTYSIWVWFYAVIPAQGTASFDDVSLEVLGPATGVIGPPGGSVAPAANTPPAPGKHGTTTKKPGVKH